MENNIPFPQADDFQKIVNLINVCNDDNLSDNRFVSSALGDVTDRQVLYYLSAAAYLGIVDNTRGCRKFTDYGIKVKNMNSFIQEAELISIILRLPVFSKVFVLEKMVGHQNVDDVTVLIKESFPSFSDAICERRAQTVIKWLKWVNEKLNQY